VKKAFSFIEVISATILLSIVMISLLKIKSENIYKINRSIDLKDYIPLGIDLNDISNKNEYIRLDKLYYVQNDDIRREFADKKVEIIDRKIKTTKLENESLSIGLTTYTRSYNIDEKLKHSIYSFKLEL
jgi:hypothetical protein